MSLNVDQMNNIVSLLYYVFNILISFTNNYRLLAQLQFQDNLAMIDNIEDIKGLCYFGMTLYFTSLLYQITVTIFRNSI